MIVDRRGFIMGASLASLLPSGAMAAEASPLRIPIRLSGNRVLVDCTIAGRGPYSLIFDTGGTIGLLDLRLAHELNGRPLGSMPLRLQSGHRPYPIYEFLDLTFSDQLRQHSVSFAGVENFRFDDGIVGSLAAGALTATNGELDFDAMEWRIYPGSSPDRSGWTRYDKAIVRRGNPNGSPFLFADATLSGRTFSFGVDTGTQGAMHVYRKTAEAAGLWDAPRWSPGAPGGKARMVRASSLQLAGVTMNDVIVTLLEEPEYDYFNQGVIGLPVLRRFNMATVEKDGALFLKRNGLDSPADHYNRVGLWIDREGKDARITVVGPGSPASEAGLVAGDRLLEANFDQLLKQMYAPAGTSINLRVERGASRRELTLQNADFL